MVEQEKVVGATTDVEGADGNSPAQGAGEQSTSQSNGANVGGAQASAPASTETRLPYHKDPEAQRWLNSQLSKREREWQKQLQQSSEQHRRELDLLRAGMGRNNAPAGNPEEEHALNLLAEKLLANPLIREKYGLDGAKSAQAELQKLREEQTRVMVDNELESVVGKYAVKYGYEPQAFREELLEFLDSDEFEGATYRKGSIERAAKAYLYDRQGEISERAANLKLIKEQNDKKKVTTESSSTGTKGKPNMGEKSLSSYLDRRVDEEGGISFD